MHTVGCPSHTTRSLSPEIVDVVHIVFDGQTSTAPHTRLTATVYLYTLSSMDIHNTSEIDTASKKNLLVKETGWWLVMRVHNNSIGSRVCRDGRSSGDKGSMKGSMKGMKAQRTALGTQLTYRQEQEGIERKLLDIQHVCRSPFMMVVCVKYV